MFNKEFALATFERSVKTFAQTALSFFVIGTTGLIDLEWLALASISGAAALASVLTSIASAGINGDGPSLTKVEQVIHPD